MRAALLLLVGCGRIAFSPAEDAAADIALASDAKVCVTPAGHDEDADGVDDSCDGCPHIPDPLQPDGDGDGVDDACDPRPTLSGDSITFFDPFTTRLSAWTTVMNATYEGDSVYTAGARLTLERPLVPNNDTFVAGGEIISLPAASQHQIILGNDDAAASFYCELQSDTNGKLAATYTLDSMTYASAKSSPGPVLMPSPFMVGSFVALPTFGCRTSWPVAEQEFLTSVPGGIDPTIVGLVSSNLELRFDYYVTIHSP